MSSFTSNLSTFSPFSKKIERQYYPLNVTRREKMIITNSVEKDEDGYENIDDLFDKTKKPSDFHETPSSKKPPLTPTPKIQSLSHIENQQSHNQSIQIEEEEEVSIENSPLETKKTFIEYSPIQINTNDHFNTFDINKILNPLKTPSRAESKNVFQRRSQEEKVEQYSPKMTPILKNARATNYNIPNFSPYVPPSSNQSSPLPSTVTSPAQSSINDHKLTFQSITPIKISRDSTPKRQTEQTSPHDLKASSQTLNPLLNNYPPSSRNDIVSQIESNFASYYYDKQNQDQNANNNTKFYTTQLKSNNTNFNDIPEVNRYLIHLNNNQNHSNNNINENTRNNNNKNATKRYYRSNYKANIQDNSDDSDDFSQNNIFNYTQNQNYTFKKNLEIENTSKRLKDLFIKKQDSVPTKNPSIPFFTQFSANFKDDDDFSNYKPKPIQLLNQKKEDKKNKVNPQNNNEKYSNRRNVANTRDSNPYDFMNKYNKSSLIHSSNEDYPKNITQNNSTKTKSFDNDFKKEMNSSSSDDSIMSTYEAKRILPSTNYDDQSEQNHETQIKQNNGRSNKQRYYNQNEQRYNDQYNQKNKSDNSQRYDNQDEQEYDTTYEQDNENQNETKNDDNAKIYYPNLEFNDKYLRRTSAKRLHRNEDRTNIIRYDLDEEDSYSDNPPEPSDNSNQDNVQHDNFFPQNKGSLQQNIQTFLQDESFFPQNNQNKNNSKFKKKSSSSNTDSDHFDFTPPTDQNSSINQNETESKNNEDAISNIEEEEQQTNLFHFDQDLFEPEQQPEQQPEPEQNYELLNEPIDSTYNIEPENQNDENKTSTMELFSIEQVNEAPIFQSNLLQTESHSTLTYTVLDPSPPINQSNFDNDYQHHNQSPIRIPSIIALNDSSEIPTKTTMKRIPRDPNSVSNGIFNFDIDKTSTESDNKKTDNNKNTEDLSRKVGKNLIGQIKTPKSILKKRAKDLNMDIENFNTPVKKLRFERPQNNKSIKSMPISPAPNVNKPSTPLPAKVQSHEEESSDEVLFQDSYINSNDDEEGSNGEENEQIEFSSAFSPNPFSTPIRKKPSLAEMEQNSIRKVRRHHRHHSHQNGNEEEEENEEDQTKAFQEQERLKQQQLEEEERLRQRQLEEEEEKLKQQQLEEEERLKQQQIEEEEMLKQKQFEEEERQNQENQNEDENTQKSDTNKRRKKKHKNSSKNKVEASTSPRQQKLSAQTQTQTPQREPSKPTQNDSEDESQSSQQAVQNEDNESFSAYPALPDISEDGSQVEEDKRNNNTNSPNLSFEEMHNTNFPNFPSMPDSKKGSSSSDEFEGSNNSGTVVNMASFRSPSPQPVYENFDQASLPSPPSSPRGSESANQQRIQLQSEEDGETGAQPDKDSISTKWKKNESKPKRTKKTATISPVVDNYDPEFDNLPIALRRAKRPHTQPLRHWMNEKIIYKVADNGCFTQYAVQTDLQNSDIIDPLSPSTADTIDNIIIESQKLRKEKSQKQKSSSSNLDSEVIPKRIIPGIENSASSIISFKGIEKRTLKSNEIEILPDKSLELDASKKKIVVVFSSGKSAQIEYRNGKKWKIKAGGQAYICKGDFATVRNMSNDESVHLFVIYN